MPARKHRGGGSPVDPTTIISTGDFKWSYGTGVLTGFVRCNGRTIGSSTSGASERANSDTQALYVNFWTADPNLAVSGGRGATAAADYAANKTLALPDCRGRVVAGLDDLGNSAAGVLTSTYFGATTTTLGAISTTTDHTTLVTTNLPPYTPAGNVNTSITEGGSYPQLNGILSPGSNVGVGGSNTGGQAISLHGLLSANSSFTGTAQGGTSTPFANVPPTILMTVYIKL